MKIISNSLVVSLFHFPEYTQRSHSVKRAKSQYFELVFEKSNLLRQKNTKEITITRKGTRMVKNGED